MNDSIKPPPATVAAHSEVEIRSWLRTRLSHLAEIDSEQIAMDKPLESYGIDSLQATQLTEDLQRWLGRELSPTLAWDYPTIDALAKYLARN